MRFLICFSLLSLPGTAYSATTTIYDVVNYGSRTGTGLPGSGVAQGALFAITGSNLGPDPAMRTERYPHPWLTWRESTEALFKLVLS